MLVLLVFALSAAGIAVALWLRSRLRYNRRIAAQQAEIQAQRIREMQQEQKLLALDAINRASIVKLPAADKMPPWMGG